MVLEKTERIGAADTIPGTDMIYDVTLDCGWASVQVSLTYRAWVPGRDPWVFRGGSGLAGVRARNWEIVKAAGRLNMFADFEARKERLLFTLDGFGSLRHDPAVGDTGAGFYSGPAGLFDAICSWEITAIR